MLPPDQPKNEEEKDAKVLTHVKKDVNETHSCAFLGRSLEKLFKPRRGSGRFIDSREAVETITTGSGSFEITGSRFLVGVSVQPWGQFAIALLVQQMVTPLGGTNPPRCFFFLAGNFRSESLLCWEDTMFYTVCQQIALTEFSENMRLVSVRATP